LAGSGAHAPLLLDFDETHANLALVQQRNATSSLFLARYPLALSRKWALAGGL